MKKFFKILGIALVALIVLVVGIGIYGSTLPKRGSVTSTLTMQDKTVIIHSFDISTKKKEDSTEYTFGDNVLVAKDGAFFLNDKELDLDTQKSIEIILFEDGRLEFQRP